MFRIEDLRNRVLFTLALLALSHRAHIPTPGINTAVLEQLFTQSAGSVFGHFRSFQRRQFPPSDDFRARHHAVHHLVDYLQLMTVVFHISRPAKKGELGRRKITQYTRYLTIVLSIIQSFTIAQTLQAASAQTGSPWSTIPDWDLS